MEKLVYAVRFTQPLRDNSNVLRTKVLNTYTDKGAAEQLFKRLVQLADKAIHGGLYELVSYSPFASPTVHMHYLDSRPISVKPRVVVHEPIDGEED